MPLDPSFPETERTLVFGAERNLVATLTLPVTARSAPYAVLLTNVGIMPRIGPYRVNVEMARRFAQIGIPSLRFDLSGLGDSRRGADPQPVAQQWVQDTRAALDEAERQLDIKRFVMIGVCSGADVAYMTAPQDARLGGVVLFDPYLYPTRRTALIGLGYRLRRQGLAATARGILRRLSRLARRRFMPGSIEQEPEEGTLRYGPSVPPLDEFAGRLGATVARGARVLMLYSGSYPYYHNYEQQTADNLRPYGIADKVEFGMIRESDHVLMGLAGRRKFIERCVETTERWFGAQ